MEERGEVERVGRRICATEQLVQCAVRPIQKPWVPFHQRGPLLCARKVTAEYIVGDTQARTSSFCNSRSRRRPPVILRRISFSRAAPPTNDSGKRISSNRDIAASALPLLSPFFSSTLSLCLFLSRYICSTSDPRSSTILLTLIVLFDENRVAFVTTIPCSFVWVAASLVITTWKR